MLIKKIFEIRFIRLAVLISFLNLFLVGCSTMVSSKEELENLGDNEGIVIGSFLIEVEAGKEDESAWAFLGGRKAGESNHEFLIHKKPSSIPNPLDAFNPTYGVEVIPREEKVFIKNLPAGEYQIYRIEQKGFSNLIVNLTRYFTVKPRQKIYIGRLTALFPHRVMTFDEIITEVADAKVETINSLKSEYGETMLSDVVTELMQ